MCKLICLSTTKAREKPSDYGWVRREKDHSRIVVSKSLEKLTINRKSHKAKDFKSPGKIVNDKKSLERNDFQSLEKITIGSKSPYAKNFRTPGELSPTPTQQSLNGIWPTFDTPKSTKSEFRPKSLISVRNLKRKREPKQADWIQPMNRLGFVGSMFSKLLNYSPSASKKLKRRLNQLKNLDENFQEEGLYVEYKEPYIQQILEKKMKKLTYSKVLGMS